MYFCFFKKNIFNFFVLFMFLFSSFMHVEALDLNDFGDGNGNYLEGFGCYSVFGCNVWDVELGYRISLVDSTGKLIDNTYTIEFNSVSTGKNALATTSQQSNTFYSGDNYGHTSSYNKLYFGSSIVGTENQDSNYNMIHNVYLGDTSGDKRVGLINYIKSLEKGIGVYDNLNSKIEISFIDYFLKVSNYTDNYDTTSNTTVLRKLSDKDYYLLIEPVYEYAKCVATDDVGGEFKQDIDNEFGCYYMANHGTPKQLASYFTSSSDYENLRKYYGYHRLSVGYDNDILNTHMCNFYSDQNVPFLKGDNSRCKGSGYFSHYAFDTIERVGGACIYTNKYGFTYDIYGIYTTGCVDGRNILRQSFKNASYYLDDLADRYSMYGVNVISLTEIVKEIETAYNCNISISNCNNDSFIFSSELLATDIDGSPVSPYNCIYPVNDDIKAQTSKYISNYVDEKLWCYDDVTYDFSGVKEVLDGGKYITNQLLEIPSGKLKVKRTCYAAPSSDINNPFDGQFDDTLKYLFTNDTNIEKYQKEFVLDFNNKSYKFVIQNNVINNTDGTDHIHSGVTNNGKNYNRIISYNKEYKPSYVEYSGTFYYEYYLENEYKHMVDNLLINLNDYTLIDSDDLFLNDYKIVDTQFDSSSIIRIPSNPNGEYSTAVTVNLSPSLQQNSESYGLSNGIFRNTNFNSGGSSIDGNAVVDSNVILDYSVSIGDSSSCKANFEIDDYGDIAVFRTISLSNPFPARDGTSRMPGVNWFNESKNYVDTYITNNRDVKEDEVYNLEPIYTITLDTSTMINIRNYNKSHSYTDFSLVCNITAGQECYSSFLRDTSYISSDNFGGKCKDVEDVALLKEIFECAVKNISGGNCFDSRYDVNNDGVVDIVDSQMVRYNAKFYECADKEVRAISR